MHVEVEGILPLLVESDVAWMQHVPCYPEMGVSPQILCNSLYTVRSFPSTSVNFLINRVELFVVVINSMPWSFK